MRLSSWLPRAAGISAAVAIAVASITGAVVLKGDAPSRTIAPSAHDFGRYERYPLASTAASESESLLERSADSSESGNDSEGTLTGPTFEGARSPRETGAGIQDGADLAEDAQYSQPLAFPVGQPNVPATPPSALGRTISLATPTIAAPEVSPPPTETPTPRPPAPTATSTPRPPAAAPVPPTATPVPPAPRPPAPAPSLAGLEQEMFAAHNQERAAAGLGTLRIDGMLVRIARERAQDMASRNYFSHTSPSGQTAFDLMLAYGFSAGASGENLARNNYPAQQSVSAAMVAFMNSAGHRENLLDRRYTRVGIGYAVGPDGMNYYAVLFAAP